MSTHLWQSVWMKTDLLIMNEAGYGPKDAVCGKPRAIRGLFNTHPFIPSLRSRSEFHLQAVRFCLIYRVHPEEGFFACSTIDLTHFLTQNTSSAFPLQTIVNQRPVVVSHGIPHRFTSV